ncbi:MAG: hypothetical protein ACRCSN_03535 [Dermatophilaceae bacterium]
MRRTVTTQDCGWRPAWMKRNGHDAWRASGEGDVDNGLPPERVCAEGTDAYVLEEEYLDAYARSFARFVDADQELGIRVETVLPQNEFDSAQVFPSCTWTTGPELRRPQQRRGCSNRANPAGRQHDHAHATGGLVQHTPGAGRGLGLTRAMMLARP